MPSNRTTESAASIISDMILLHSACPSLDLQSMPYSAACLFACMFLFVPLSQFGTPEDVGTRTSDASSISPDFSMRITLLPDALPLSRIFRLSSSFSAELSPSVSSISLNCLYRSYSSRGLTPAPARRRGRPRSWGPPCSRIPGGSASTRRRSRACGRPRRGSRA